MAAFQRLGAAPLDSDAVDAGRFRPAQPAISRRDAEADRRYAGRRGSGRRGASRMSPTLSGILILVSLFGLLGTGMPIAFALGLSALAAIALEGGMIGFLAVPETLFAGIANLAYVSIPMFVLMG